MKQTCFYCKKQFPTVPTLKLHLIQKHKFKLHDVRKDIERVNNLLNPLRRWDKLVSLYDDPLMKIFSKHRDVDTKRRQGFTSAEAKELAEKKCKQLWEKEEDEWKASSLEDYKKSLPLKLAFERARTEKVVESEFDQRIKESAKNKSWSLR